jgi:hypothetical protein
LQPSVHIDASWRDIFPFRSMLFRVHWSHYKSIKKERISSLFFYVIRHKKNTLSKKNKDDDFLLAPCWAISLMLVIV